MAMEADKTRELITEQLKNYPETLTAEDIAKIMNTSLPSAYTLMKTKLSCYNIGKGDQRDRLRVFKSVLVEHISTNS